MRKWMRFELAIEKTTKTEDVNEQKADWTRLNEWLDDRVREEEKDPAFIPCELWEKKATRKLFLYARKLSSTWDALLLACNKKLSEVV